MPHGYPDWGGATPVATVYNLQDLAELAARLGSIDTFDRRGNVIAFDDFESGIEQWRRSGAGAYSIDWDSKYAKTGGFSCRITTDSGWQATISKYIGFPVLSKIGVEFSFSYTQNWQYLYLEVLLQDGVSAFYTGIRYNAATKMWQYRATDGSYQDIPGSSFTLSPMVEEFDTVKLVIDFSTGKYSRLLINSQVFDLSALSFYQYAAVLTPVMNVSITVKALPGELAIGNIDDVIVTQNEP